MHGLSPTDGNRKIDWSKTSDDYATHRPGYPRSFFERLKRYNIGAPGQRILDLGTGTGALAREFASAGAEVTGVDIAPGQIEAARKLADDSGLTVRFGVADGHDTGFADNSFDLITASQCWLYFDKKKIIAEVKRLLAPGGRLMTSHLSWLARHDRTAQLSEALVKKHNPDWSAGDWDGRVDVFPEWAREDFALEAMFYYDEPIPFTRESWRGRIRACRGVGATLSPEQVAAFDKEHEKALRDALPEEFSVLHRIDAHIFTPNTIVPPSVK